MSIKRSDYRPPSHLVEHVELELDLDEAHTRVRSRLEVYRNPEHQPAGDAAPPLFLDGEGLELHEVRLDGTPLDPSRYRHEARGLRLPEVPERFTLETEVTIHPDRNEDLMGLYASEGVLCTQCEPEAFRRITFFPDRPDVLSTFRVTLTADRDRYPVLLSNGNPIDSGDIDEHRHRVVWDDPHPKPSYLFALAAGRLEWIEDEFITASGRRVALRLYTEPGASERGRHALDALKRAMAWDESRYGCEYDLDVFNVLAISQYTMGAMENKGLNIFNDRYVLADPDLSTDRDYRNIEALVAHEYFHNWSGNRVTCRDWFQLSLKEGFTVLREQQFVAEQGWGAVRRIEDARLMRERQFAEDAGPLAHPVRPEAYREIENFYTDTVYSKGAEILRMLSLIVGTDGFRRATDLYFSRHDGRAATVEDLLECAAEVSGLDLSAFKHWYALAGTPSLALSGEYDEAAGVWELTVEQTLDGRESELHLPLAVGFLDERGRPLAFTAKGRDVASADTLVIDVTAPRQRFRFEGLAQEPVPALLRHFSAPVRMRFDYSVAELAVLAADDPDGFTRWDAMQRLATRCLQHAGREAADPRAEQALRDCLEGVLAEPGRDPGLAAELLELPGLMTLAAGREAPDLEAIDEARKGLRARLADTLLERFGDVYRSLEQPGPYRTGPEEVGRRALRKQCLSYLATGGGERSRALCLEHYRAANNMSDRIAALELLAGEEGPQREEALADFEQRWRAEPLAMDKWFQVQAVSGGRDGLERVEALMNHPLFGFDQPNRVRSVIEAFCTGNPLGFNHPDGSGYRFLADCVERLDRSNPPLAAGLLRHLVDWRGCRRELRELRREALRRLQCDGQRSEQVAEIIATALEAGSAPHAV